MLKTIQDWEKEFVGQFPKISLLSEIELSQADFELLTDEIRKLIKRSPSLTEATRRLIDKYPHTLVVFLAHFAARNTNREFWDAVANLLQEPGAGFHNLKWHYHFIEILRDNRKKTFEDVGGSTNKYVTSMRIHGGIPSYSLDDFFKNMVLPAIEKDRYAGLKSSALLQALLERTDVQFFTDSPVRNFFENSGEIGLEFLSESVRMAQAYRRDGETPSNLNLPSYVPERFIAFMERQVDIETRLKSPRLVYDPEGVGLVVELPQQQISAKDLAGKRQAIWQVIWDGQETPVQKPIRLIFSGRDIIARANEQTIPIPVSRVRVAFGLQNDNEIQVLRHWVLPFLPNPDQPQLVAFSLSASGNACPIIRSTQNLPAKVVLLFYPARATLKADGNADMRHECDPLRGAWSNWQAHYWSLEEATCLYLEQPGRETVAIRITAPSISPTLVDGRLYPSADPKNIPLYLGAPPRLRLPHRSGLHWKVRLESVWETLPTSLHYDFPESALILVEDSLEVDLESVLSVDAAGTFTISFSNGIDVDDEIRFRIWPRMAIENLPEAIFPLEQIAHPPAPVKFNLKLPVAATCEPITPSDDLQLSGQYGQFSITLSDSVTHADLNLVLPTGENAEPVRVPVYIPIPRLQWRINLPGEEDSDWTTTPLQRSVATVLQAIHNNTAQISIFVKMPGLDSIASRLQFVLADPDNPSDIVKIDPERRLRNEDYLRYSINKQEATLTVRRVVSAFSFTLQLYDTHGIQASANLLTLTRALEISNVWIELRGELDYTLHWKEPAPLRNRRVFLYPTWQPWNEGQEFSIPNDAQGELVLKDIGLPHSDYEAYFYIAPYSDAPARTTCPASEHHHFKTISATEQLNNLTEQIKRNPKRAFQCHFERACIYASQNQADRMNEEIAGCLEFQEQAGLKILTYFYEWLGQHNPVEQKALRHKMLTPNRVKDLYTGKSDNFLRQIFLQYAQHRTLATQSAIVILEHETSDPQLILFCLRLLLERRERKGVEFIIARLRAGTLLDNDAIDLLTEQLDFSILALSETLNTPEALRIFWELFKRHQDHSALVQSLSTSSLIYLVNQKQESDTIRLFLAQLISRGEKAGLKRIMVLFQQADLRGDEVTELLGHNPSFAFRVLSTAPAQTAHNTQMQELAQKYPTEIGHTTTNYLNPPTRPFPHSAAEGQANHIGQLLHKGDKAGVYQALNLHQQGAISRSQLLEVFSTTPKLCHQTLLEHAKSQQYQAIIVDLARRFPLETGYIVPGMSIHTPGGWGLVEKIHRAHQVRCDIAALEEVDIILHVTLHPQFHPESALVELGDHRLVFDEDKTIFQCLVCKEFISSNLEIVQQHHARSHREVVSIRKHNPIVPFFPPLQLRPPSSTTTVSIEKHPRRDDESLWLASLSNKQLLHLLEITDLSSALARASIYILLKKEQEDCLEFLLKQLINKSISDDQAMNFFGTNPLFAYEFFENQPLTRKPSTLMQILKQKYPNEIY